ncbi:caspase family protein [Streptomyces sp. NPDC051940]|uniref:caspase, EACC1-associated type n=1 Tax=Streptomyces sp. NPDC051940 TaxID=3155675 RepID=UPI00342EA1FB
MYRALIVCNSRFAKDASALPELNGPKADGMLLRDALTDPGTGMFDRSNVALLPEADAPEVLDAVDDFFAGAEPDDTLLLYYSGHGRSLGQELYLCAGNTRADRLESSAVASSTLSRMINRSFAQVKIVILDCCHGGGFKGGDLVEGLSGRGRFVLAAASAADRAGDAERRGEPSPFTKALVEGLLTGAADGDGDGAVDLDDLYAHVARVRFNGHEPQRKYDGAGAVPIARRTDAPAGPPPIPVQPAAPAPQGADLLESVAPGAILDDTRIRSFRGELREDMATAYPPQLTSSEFLQRSGLVREGRPTYAAALLFGENPSALLPTAMVRCARFRGRDKTRPLTGTELHGTLPELIVQARDFVASAALLGELPTAEGATSDGLYRYPMIAVREIIANALVHRDYTHPDACVQIHVYDDRVEVISPGTWGGGVPVPDGQQRLGTLERQSQPRNFRLARVLSWAKLVESVGAGLPRSVADCRAVGAPEPVVAIRQGMITVTVFPLVAPAEDSGPPATGVVVPAPRTGQSSTIEVHRMAGVTLHGDAFVRGMAYRVTSDTALTAAHVVADAGEYALRFPHGATPWEARVEVVFADASADVAVLRFTPPGEAEVVAPVRYGRVSTGPEFIEVEAAGLSRYEMSGSSPGLFELVHAKGVASSLASRRTSPLSIQFTPAAWHGVSGSPVWAEGLLVGIVNRRHRKDDATVLAARIDGLLVGSSPEHAALPALLGIPEPVDLPETPAPALPRSSGYLARVQDLAPERLSGRNGELTELLAFCRGDAPYARWRGRPWSGKTALASYFTLQPPPDVDVLSFFVTSRLAGQNDSSAFTDALVDQLCWYLDEPRTTSSVQTGALDTLRRRLLADAAGKAQQQRRRLLLVVDGIDEDLGPATGLPSIASLLPATPGPGLRVLVTGREVPLPDDVSPAHPLRACPVHELEPWTLAGEPLRAAGAELSAVFTGSEAQRDVVGLALAAGGEVTVAVLAELAGVAPYEVDRMLAGGLGRLFRFTRGGPPDGGSVHIAHHALETEARRLLGERLMQAYEDRYFEGRLGRSVDGSL